MASSGPSSRTSARSTTPEPRPESSPLPAQPDAIAQRSGFPLVWFWKPQKFPGRTVDRKGQRCRVFARARLNSVGVEFPDGFKVVVSRYAVRPAEPSR